VAERELSPAQVLAASGARVLIVHGALDGIVPLANSRKLAAMLGPAVCHLVVLPAAGHMPHEAGPSTLSTNYAVRSPLP
jgi:pimeloyl-ACP methyl ester carboxylesterase